MSGLQNTRRGILRAQINRCTSIVNPSLTPVAYAATLTATDDRLRNPDQLRRSPVAQLTPQGVQNPETLTVAG
jgi:hypothetical protein